MSELARSYQGTTSRSSRLVYPTQPDAYALYARNPTRPTIGKLKMSEPACSYHSTTCRSSRLVYPTQPVAYAKTQPGPPSLFPSPLLPRHHQKVQPPGVRDPAHCIHCLCKEHDPARLAYFTGEIKDA
jgi:hypothetical protein